MKTVIDVSINEVVPLGVIDLPMLVHGADKSGASLFSITVAAQLHKEGNKLLIFTAYSMAKDEFLSQLGEEKESVFYLTSLADIEKAKGFQSVIVEHGNEALFLSVLEQLPNLSEYVPFIKNVETVTELDIIYYALARPSVLSGDIMQSTFSEELIAADYTTRVLFTPLEEEPLPELEKYQALMKGKDGQRIVSIR